MMKRVMIVDDSKVLRAKMRMMLEELEYEVVAEAVDGQDAVEKYSGIEVDFVTMDVEMPRLSGPQAVEEMVKLNPQLKVVWVSTVANQNVIHEARRLCQSVFVQKPLHEQRLKDAVEMLMHLQRERS
jgi:two-component system chemotaxis response regulator CheY